MDNKLKINILSFISIFYILFIIINDYFCFIFKANSSIIFYIISFLICFLFYMLIRKKVNIVKIDFNRIDFVFLIIILMVFLARITIPDSSFDTLNYHLYLQERLFSNNVSFNFFPARWINTFSFPLSDRIHYFFRMMLGYRLGIFANLLFIIVIFFQVKCILGKFIENKSFISIMSGLVLITEQILSNMITYYVDIMAIPLFLEIIILLLYNKKVNNFISCFVLFISGILVSLKVSNAFLLIPLAIIYLVKYRKDINYKTFVFGIPMFIIPLLVYLLNNYLQTGNPVFPFYNSIFKSKYLLDTNWMENFYGPKTKLERLLWPIYLFKYPRRAFDVAIYYGRIGYGYIISLSVIFDLIYKRLFKKIRFDLFFYLNVLYVIFCLIWSNFMMGYIRYALILEVLSGINLSIFIYNNFKSKNIIYIIACLFCVFSFAKTTVLSMSDMLYGVNESSWRYPYYLDRNTYNDNLKLLFNRSWDYSSQIDMVDCFGIVDYNAGYASLLSKNKRIVNLNEGYGSDYGEDKFKKIVKECSNIYTVSTSSTVERTEKYLDTAGYRRKGEYISFKADFVNYDNDVLIFEIIKK